MSGWLAGHQTLIAWRRASVDPSGRRRRSWNQRECGRRAGQCILGVGLEHAGPRARRHMMARRWSRSFGWRATGTASSWAPCDGGGKDIVGGMDGAGEGACGEDEGGGVATGERGDCCGCRAKGAKSCRRSSGSSSMSAVGGAVQGAGTVLRSGKRVLSKTTCLDVMTRRVARS